MLTSLHIENIAVIEKTDIEFNSGFNVLTGETGVGKSIVIDAINAVLGERTPRDLIRSDTDYAFVSAVFDNLDEERINALNEIGFSVDDGSLLISRKLTLDGKNHIFINGSPANVTVLKDVAKRLVNIHGQHDNQSLLNPSSHIKFIDAIADNSDIKTEYNTAYDRYKELLNKLTSLQSENARSDERIDLLRYQIGEIEAAEIEVGERDSLIKQRDFIRNRETIVKALYAAQSIINGGQTGSDIPNMLFDAANQLSACEEYFKSAASLAEKVNGFGYELQEISDEISALYDKLEFDPHLADDIESRLDYLYRLSSKYGKTEEDMLNYLANAKEELSLIENYDRNLEQLSKQVDSAFVEANKLATKLSLTRKKASEHFVKRVTEELEFLNMPKVVFVCDIKETELLRNGTDKIEFNISVNPGEPAKPISKVASGGELSRIMLAIKSALADKNDVPTLIFDEIDTGISGNAAQKVGIKLKNIAKSEQVICVTHLPQIASLADNHFKINKRTENNRTFTDVELLSYGERVDEIARMMSGDIVSSSILASAKEMIDYGKNL